MTAVTSTSQKNEHLGSFPATRICFFEELGSPGHPIATKKFKQLVTSPLVQVKLMYCGTLQVTTIQPYWACTNGDPSFDHCDTSGAQKEDVSVNVAMCMSMPTCQLNNRVIISCSLIETQCY
eukprot:GHVQ01019718.1.p2 GENE.GHVQ01019718.1~~GHVQ01019718.1.p2  ORF type:complete len:122 (-),score=9.58 GHVQ01019718.1:5-370(-)